MILCLCKNDAGEGKKTHQDVFFGDFICTFAMSFEILLYL